MKKILIIDDSALMRRIYCAIISEDNKFKVQDVAENGVEGLKLVKENTYDLILLDIMMPEMDGLTFLKELNRLNCTTKVIVISSVVGEGTKTTIEALSLGAADFIKKPNGILGEQGDKFRTHFTKVLYEVVFGDEKQISLDSATRKKALEVSSHNHSTVEHRSGDKIVAIASSTGGPKALMEVIPHLPGGLDAPVIVVQHMPSGFTKSLADRLDSVSHLHVIEAEDGMTVEKGNVYIAKGGLHMEIRQSGGGNRIRLYDGDTREGVKPCANYMFESLAKTSYQKNICVVLTGMGADGTEGILNLKSERPVTVISQSKETCAVYGMPRCVDAAGLTDEVVPLSKVAAAIIKNVGVITDGR